MTAPVVSLDLHRAMADCRDLAAMCGVAPAVIAERQMEQAAKRGDQHFIYSTAHGRFTTEGRSHG